jgi:hypothetical protein
VLSYCAQVCATARDFSSIMMVRGLATGHATLMMCQPASQVGHRYLGVRKKGEPDNQCWICLTIPAYILWPVAAGTVVY